MPLMVPGFGFSPSSKNNFRAANIHSRISEKYHFSSTTTTSSSSTQLQMVQTQSSPEKQRASTTAASTSTAAIATPTPKYPTQRGAEVDARKIIATGAGRQYLTAIRLAHILFASRDLAEASLHELRSASISFEDLAQQISNCPETRTKGGHLGWISISEDKHTDNDPDEHLNELFPQEAREQIVQITTKPGDVVLVESSTGYHLVQIVDVMADVRKMAFRKQRRTVSHRGNPIPDHPTTTSNNNNKTYQLETMGCQMNSADSERMEGQLQSLGIRPYDKDTDGGHPDVVVLNTCSIRDHAEQKVYSYIGPHAKRKREGEDVTIIVAGCVAQQEGEALLRRAPEVDLVMGPQVRTNDSCSRKPSRTQFGKSFGLYHLVPGFFLTLQSSILPFCYNLA